MVEETGFGQYLAGAPDGVQAAANVSRLIHLTRQFDGFRGEGLYRFLQFVQAQQENELEAEPAGQPLRDAVRLMSIHQSKGLEFPIVALADLGKRFNLEDTRGRVILDEELGLCPQVKPPGLSQFYPSLPHWLAQRRQKRETFGEELRLLYVALTRAADRLILCGSARRKTIAEKWPQAAERGLGAAEILAGRSFLDWLGAWLALKFGPEAPAQSGGNSLLGWKVIEEQEPAAAPGQQEAAPAPPPRDAQERLLRRSRAALQWRYGFEEATRRAAKTSVSALSRALAEEEDDESELLFTPPPGILGERRAGPSSAAETVPARQRRPAGEGRSGELSAAETGSAHHAFLERVALAETGSAASLQMEAARMRREGSLSEAQAACLDFQALAAFWQSEVGRQLLARREEVRREVAFTARFAPSELEELQGRGGELGKPASQLFEVGRAVPRPPPGDGTESNIAIRSKGGQGTARPALRQPSKTDLSPEGAPPAVAAEGCEEFVIVQGVMDLAAVTPEEIWVLDFKTDHFAEPELEAKVRQYRPQLTLYARAIARIYGLPVTRRWLHFFAVGRTVELDGN